jgi:hypothetical protein
MMNSTNYEVPHYAILSSLLLNQHVSCVEEYALPKKENSEEKGLKSDTDSDCRIIHICAIIKCLNMGSICFERQEQVI